MGVALGIRSLGGALLAAIAMRVTTGTPVLQGKAGSEVRHQTNSVFGRAARALVAFDVAEELPDGRILLSFDADHVAEAWVVGKEDAGFPALAAAFLALACHYDGLPAGRSWFRPPQSYRDIMAAFSVNGLARCQDDLFRWRSDIAPFMKDAGLWAAWPAMDDLQRRELRVEEARRAWAEMPIFVQRRFFSSDQIDVVKFVSVVAHCWDGKRWRPFTKDRRFLDVPDARQLADRMIELSLRFPKKGRGPR